jgi:hypothetical protein
MRTCKQTEHAHGAVDTHQTSGRNTPPPQTRRMFMPASLALTTSCACAAASYRPSSSSIGIMLAPRAYSGAPFTLNTGTQAQGTHPSQAYTRHQESKQIIREATGLQDIGSHELMIIK